MAEPGARRPRIVFDPDALGHNTARLAASCTAHGISFAAVTKATGGNPRIARLMLANGADMLADSRLANIARLRRAGIEAPVMLLRAPAMGEIAEAARLADICLLSEPGTISRLARARAALGHRLEVVLMVDLGDLREGVPAAGLPHLVRLVAAMDNVDIVGLGSNLACNLGVLPDRDNMAALAAMARQVQARIGRPLRYLSAGNSSALPLMLEGGLPPEINHLRLGESLLLGRETAHGRHLPGMRDDCFAVVAQVIETHSKSPPAQARCAPNALGRRPGLPRAGPRRLAVLNIGAVDCEIGGLRPDDSALRVMGYSSDHMILDTTDAENAPAVGDEIRLWPDYHALATGMTSPYLAQVGEDATGPSGARMAARRDSRCLPTTRKAVR